MPADAKAVNVAVTGAAGYIAQRVIGSLLDDDRVGRVVGFDVRRPRFSHARFVFDEVDVRDRALEERLRGIDVVVHLAFVMDPIHDEAEMRDINVNGSQNVFRCAGAAGVGKVVYTSSATVYGAHPDNDVPLTEDSPLRANLDFSYPAHKLEVEYVVREIEEEFPDLAFTIFRPAIVFGPNVDNAWSHAMEAPVLVGVEGRRPPLQFVHEEDVAAAIHDAIVRDLPGIYNLAPGDWTDGPRLTELLGRRVLDLPEPTAFAVLERMWGWGVAEAPAGMLHYVMYPWVVSPAKLEAAGFRCERSSEAVFVETAERLREHVLVGRKRFRRKDLRRGGVATAAAFATLVSLRTIRRRRAA